MPDAESQDWCAHRMAAADNGAALLIATMVIVLLSSMTLAILMTTTAEMLTGSNYRRVVVALYAADAGIERALPDLAAAPDWTAVLNGSQRSTFTDGPPAGSRTLADGRTVDLASVVNVANCGQFSGCTAADLDEVTDRRPWGPNNPRWRPFAYGRVADLLPGAINSQSCYIIVLVADDPAETDGDPSRDGIGGENPGADTLVLRAEAFGTGGMHKVVEATIVRSAVTAGRPAVRCVGWHEIRAPAL